MANEKKRFYIGNGKAVVNYPSIVEVSIDLEEAMKHAFEYEGKKYVKFSVAPKNPDNIKKDDYGRTHNIYVFGYEPKEVEAPTQPEPTPFADRTVADLKAILKGRGLATNGNKAELVARLEA
jgi:hypothetical protein